MVSKEVLEETLSEEGSEDLDVDVDLFGELDSTDPTK